MHQSWNHQKLEYSLNEKIVFRPSTPLETQMRLLMRRISRRTVALILLLVFGSYICYNFQNWTSRRLQHSNSNNSAIMGASNLPNFSRKRRSSIGKVTMMYGDNIPEIYNQVLAGHQRHADAHGYDMYVLRQRLLHRLWSKSAYMLSVLLQESEKPRRDRLKWLFWFDADVILLNTEIPLEIFLPPEPEFRHINLIVTNDHNGLNSGGFFIRVSEWAIQFFADAVAMPTYRPDVRLKYSEQSAMENLAVDDLYRNNTIFVPQRWFNAYRGPRDANEVIRKGAKIPENTVQRGDLQLHFAGKPENKDHMPFWIHVSEGRTWQVPLKNTTYPKEIKEFWEREKRRIAKKKKEL